MHHYFPLSLSRAAISECYNLAGWTRTGNGGQFRLIFSVFLPAKVVFTKVLTKATRIQFFYRTMQIKICYFQTTSPKRFCAEIKHFILQGKTLEEIKAELDVVHICNYNWTNEFRRGRTYSSDKYIPGRPSKMINKLHYMTLRDRKVKFREFFEATW